MNNKITYTIEYQNEAQADLQDIASYYNEVAGLMVANQNIERILNSIDGLHQLPHRCPLASFSQTIHKLTVPNLPYLVFYKVVGDKVHILNIFHAKHDPKWFKMKLKNQ